MTSSNGAQQLPDNHEDYGIVHDPHPVEDGLPVLDGIDEEITKHICRVEDGQPLCGAPADDAPVYPFRGMRSQIREGLGDCCPDCRDRLAEIASVEVDGQPVATDGGRDHCASGNERDPFESVGECPPCGTTVRYSGYVPRIYLCADCGGERPHAEGVVERDGRLYYEPESDENPVIETTDTAQSEGDSDV